MPAEAFTFDEAVGPETFSFEDAIRTSGTAKRGAALRSLQAEIAGQDRFARWLSEDRPLLPPIFLPPEAPGSLENLVGGETAPGVVRAGVSAIRTVGETLPEMTRPSVLPVAPIALIPGGAPALGIYFGGQALGAGAGELSVARTPEEVGVGIGQMGLGALMASAPVAKAVRPILPPRTPFVPIPPEIGPGIPAYVGEQLSAAAAAPKPKVPAAAVAPKVGGSYAIQVGSPAEVYVRPPPGNREAVGAQVRDAGEPAGARPEVRPPGNAPSSVGSQPAGAGEVPLKPFPADRLTELEPPEGELSGRNFEVKEGEFTTASGQKYTKGTVLSESQLRSAGYEPPVIAVKAAEKTAPAETAQPVEAPLTAEAKEVTPNVNLSGSVFVTGDLRIPLTSRPLPAIRFGPNEIVVDPRAITHPEMRLSKKQHRKLVLAKDDPAGWIYEGGFLTRGQLAERISGAAKIEASKAAEAPLTTAQKAEVQAELEAEVSAAAAEPAMEEAVAMGASKPSEHVPVRETATNITRARIDASRQERGQDPLFTAARQKNPVVFDQAMARIDQDPGWPDTLIAELSKKPRTPTPEEVAALDYRYVDLQNEYSKATRDMALAYDDGRLGDLPDIRARIDIWQEKLDAFERVARASMSEWGRAGQISQQLMREDYSLVPMLARKRAAVGGRPLTDVEIMDVQKQAIALADAGKKADAATVAAEEKVVQAQQATAERDALKTELATVKKTPKPRTKAEVDELAKKKQSLQKRIVEITRRIEKREFLSRKGKPIDVSMDPEAVRLQAQYEHLKDTFKEELERDRIRSSSFLTKAGIEGKEMLAFSRNIKSSTDVSAVLRQGAFFAFGRPLIAARNIPKMFQALGNSETSRAINHSIKLRPNALDGSYAKGGLFLSPLESVKLAAQEELVMSRWAHRVPGIKASNRAYITFLNLMRADVFDAMKAAWETKGKLTDVELQQLGNVINIGTGRGNLGKFSAAAEPLALLFFSPRLATSRFQLLAGQPMWGGTARSRVGIAKEYGRFLAGVGAFYTLAQLAGYKIGDDPRSTDFGKIRVGNTMLDPLAGLSQTTVVSTRLTTGETADLAGHVTSILADAPYGKPTVPDVIGRFLRTKLAPVPSTALSARTGKDLLGRPITIGTVARDLYMPLSIEDILTEMKKGNNALPEDLAIAVLILFGMGAQTGDKPLPRP